ncbi:hypothetical protein ACQCVH_06550 [Bacillus infantis]|uniref:hypothetical protein n=1 Tax=Bacillus infantis TaxID=324767 RepID=UPI003CE97A47
MDWKKNGKRAAIVAALTIPLIGAGMFAGTKTKIFGDDAPVVSRTIQQDDVHFSINKPKADGGDVKTDVQVPALERPVAGDSKGVNLRIKDTGKYTGGRKQKELDDLAGDPSHGGKIRDQGLKEREIGLDLEQQGKLGKIIRDPQGNGGAEFIDTTNNTKWDVKSFVSYPNGHTSPKKGAFTVSNGMKGINKELEKNYNVIVDVRDMIPEHVEQLKEAIEKAGVSNRIIWYP